MASTSRSSGRSIIRADRIKADPNEPKTYPDWESAQEAMDRGETVRIHLDPALLQLELDLQRKGHFEMWKAQGHELD